MSEVILSDYFYGDESEQFIYFRIPRLLITSPRFKHLSTDAKLLYGMLLDRMSLSAKNNWYDEDGRVYIYYTVEEICGDMNCGRDKAMKLLAELDTGKGVGLIERIKQGQGKPTKIYVKRFTTRAVLPPAPPEPDSFMPIPEVDFSDVQKSEKPTSRGRQSRLAEVEKSDPNQCFDNIDHSILLRRLYHIGIKDRRVLQIVKAMLRAGIMDECAVNEYGTPQGGIISPLLANAYLDIMDEWVAKQWERKNTRRTYRTEGTKRKSLYQTSLAPGWLIWYADDFVIITDTRAHAEQWKARLQTFLRSKLKLTLSTEKTLITDVRRKHIHFLGYELKMIPGNSRTGYITKTIPDRERLQRKVDSIAESIKKIPRNFSKEQFIGEINRINSQVRGIIQYYQCCTWVSVALRRHSHRLQMIPKDRLKQYSGRWIPANQTQNLPHIHQKHQQKIPSIKYRDIYIGFTALSFCQWEMTIVKAQAETPYSEEGRQHYFKRTKKNRMNARLDEMYSESTARAVCYSKWGRLNNFEFVMNRAYALNRDRLKCRICGGWLISVTPCTHRVDPNLPLNKVNRVNNLVSMHRKCLDAVNNPNQDISEFDTKAQKKIKGFRDKLVNSHTRNK